MEILEFTFSGPQERMAAARDDRCQAFIRGGQIRCSRRAQREGCCIQHAQMVETGRIAVPEMPMVPEVPVTPQVVPTPQVPVTPRLVITPQVPTTIQITPLPEPPRIHQPIRGRGAPGGLYMGDMELMQQGFPAIRPRPPHEPLRPGFSEETYWARVDTVRQAVDRDFPMYFDRYMVAKLKEVARTLGLSQRGLKAELQERIRDYLGIQTVPEGIIDVERPRMTVIGGTPPVGQIPPVTPFIPPVVPPVIPFIPPTVPVTVPFVPPLVPGINRDLVVELQGSTLVDLQQIARNHGLDPRGTKDQLIARISQVLAGVPGLTLPTPVVQAPTVPTVPVTVPTTPIPGGGIRGIPNPAGGPQLPLNVPEEVFNQQVAQVRTKVPGFDPFRVTINRGGYTVKELREIGDQINIYASGSNKLRSIRSFARHLGIAIDELGNWLPVVGAGGAGAPEVPQRGPHPPLIFPENEFWIRVDLVRQSIPTFDFNRVNIADAAYGNAYRVEELRGIAKALGLSPQGNKIELVDRIKRTLGISVTGRVPTFPGLPGPYLPEPPAIIPPVEAPFLPGLQVPLLGGLMGPPPLPPVGFTIPQEQPEPIDRTRLREGRGGYTVKEIKQFLTRYDLPTYGLKPELVQRLLDHLGLEAAQGATARPRLPNRPVRIPSPRRLPSPPRRLPSPPRFAEMNRYAPKAYDPQIDLGNFASGVGVSQQVPPNFTAATHCQGRYDFDPITREPMDNIDHKDLYVDPEKFCFSLSSIMDFWENSFALWDNIANRMVPKYPSDPNNTPLPPQIVRNVYATAAQRGINVRAQYPLLTALINEPNGLLEGLYQFIMRYADLIKAYDRVYQTNPEAQNDENLWERRERTAEGWLQTIYERCHIPNHGYRKYDFIRPGQGPNATQVYYACLLVGFFVSQGYRIIVTGQTPIRDDQERVTGMRDTDFAWVHAPQERNNAYQTRLCLQGR